MIIGTDLRDAMTPLLEAEGTQRFTDDIDFLPAINSALRSANAYVGAIFAENKGGEEMFRDITVTRVFQTNSLGGVILSELQLGHKVWSINAVYAEPRFLPATAAPVPWPSAGSFMRNDVTMAAPGKFHVKRITLEQVAQTENNPFMDGSERLASTPNRSYAYYWVGDRSSSAFAPGDIELVLVPSSITATKLIAISYLKGVDPITALTQSIPYPSNMFQLLRNLALNDLAIKMGSQPLYAITTQTVRDLLTVQP